MKIKRVHIVLIIAVVLFTAMLNMDVSIKQGIDGRHREIHMPLYVKWMQFSARHYEYARLAAEITKGLKTDEDKALAVLQWVHENIRDLPEGMPVYDDHILNIIIRGYGVPEQFQDVFTTICVYAGVPALFERVYDKEYNAKYSFSFVKIGGKWRVFDAYYGKYFRTSKGEIASVDDIINDHGIIEKDPDIDWIILRGTLYRNFYYDLKHIQPGKTLRGDKQMPMRRIVFEAKKLIRMEDESEE